MKVKAGLILVVLVASFFLGSFHIAQSHAETKEFNDDFESGYLSGMWDETGGTVTASHSHYGSYSCQLLGNTSNGLWLSYAYGADPGIVNQFSFWLLAYGTDHQVTVKNYFSDGYSDQVTVTPSSSVWTYYSFPEDYSGVLETSHGSAYIVSTAFQMTGSTGSAYLDDWHVQTISDDRVPRLSADLENVDNPTPPSESADLGNAYADWVYTQWRYYTFTLYIPSNVYTVAPDFVCLLFYVPSTNGTCYVSPYCNQHNGSSTTSYGASNNASSDRSKGVVMIQDGSVIVGSDGLYGSDNDYYNVSFRIWFTDNCLDVFKLANAIDVQANWNSSDGSAYGWHTIEYGFFRIYSLGVFSQSAQSTGQSYPLAGGYYFSFYGYNSTSTYRDLWFRDLQHVKFLYEVSCYVGYGSFTQSFGLNYALGDGTWITGLRCDIAADLVTTGSERYANLSVWWHSGDFVTNLTEISCFHYGGANQGDRTKWYLWVDLWFSDVNASQVVSGRVNAYEYPMKDNANAWMKWLSTNWGVAEDLTKENSFSYSLQDSSNQSFPSEQIKMVKLWSSLAVDGTPTGIQYVIVDPFLVVDYTRKLPLDGIATPAFDETKVPSMQNTGFLGVLAAGFAAMGKWINENLLFGGLSLWPTFVSFLDTISNWLGFPNGFSNMITWLSGAWGWLTTSFGYALTLFSNIFTFLGQIMSTIFTVLTQAISAGVGFIQSFLSFMGGAYGVGVDIWTTFNIAGWLTVFLVFYPLYLVLLWDQEGWDALISHLTMVWGIVSWLGEFFLKIITFVLDLMGRIIESIPVAE